MRRWEDKGWYSHYPEDHLRIQVQLLLRGWERCQERETLKTSWSLTVASRTTWKQSPIISSTYPYSTTFSYSCPNKPMYHPGIMKHQKFVSTLWVRDVGPKNQQQGSEEAKVSVPHPVLPVLPWGQCWYSPNLLGKCTWGSYCRPNELDMLSWSPGVLLQTWWIENAIMEFSSVVQQSSLC